MNNFVLNYYSKIRGLLIVLIVLLAGGSTYLLLTQPDKTYQPQKPVSFSAANPITKKLPYVDPYFTISYKTIGTGNDIIITIHTPSPRYRYYALRQFYALGYDPTDFVIEYPQYTNPLGSN